MNQDLSVTAPHLARALTEAEAKLAWIEQLCNDVHEATSKPERRLKDLANGDLRQTGMDIMARGVLGILKSTMTQEENRISNLEYLLKHKQEQSEFLKTVDKLLGK